MIASAQDLQTLTITRFTLSLADHEAATVDFTSLVHLVIRVHVREKIDRLNNVVLPDLSGFQTEGDEHTLTGGATGGSDYQEILTVTPQSVGQFVIGPATIDAVNHLTGIPSRFSSNTLSLNVVIANPTQSWLPALRNGIALVLVLIFAGVAFLIARSVLNHFSRRAASSPATPQPAPVPAADVTAPPVQPGRLVRLGQALDAARREPSRTNALELRLALRDALHAHPDETLSDILVRVPDGERGIYARALRAAERAAFIDDDARTTALEDGLAVIDAARARLEREK